MGSFDFTLSWCTKNTAGLLLRRVFVYCKQFEMLISQEFARGGVGEWSTGRDRNRTAAKAIERLREDNLLRCTKEL